MLHADLQKRLDALKQIRANANPINDELYIADLELSIERTEKALKKPEKKSYEMIA